MIRSLRSLGLTVAEIRQLAGVYLGQPDQPIGPHLGERLGRVRSRTDARIGELQQLRQRIDDFEAPHRAELAGRPGSGFRAADPRAGGTVA